MMISMYDASVGVFVPYLRNLSALLDKGVAYAESRKFNPAVLLGMICPQLKTSPLISVVVMPTGSTS